MRHFYVVVVAFIGLAAHSSQLPAQDLSVALVWKVGALDGSPEEVWMRIQDATIAGDRVYAVDIALPAVRAFSVDGKFIEELGRQGQGPGEFVRPGSITIIRDSLWLYDPAQNRYAIFDLEGRHIRTVRDQRTLSVSNHIDRIWPARHGWQVATTLLVGRGRPETSVSNHYTVAWNASRVDTVATYSGNPFWRKSQLDPEVARMSTITSNGRDGGSWLLGDSLLVHVDGRESVAHLFIIDRDRLRRIGRRDLPGASRPLTAHEREAAVAWYYQRYNIDPDDTVLIEIIPGETWPAWSKVLGDGSNGVWIRQGGSRRIDATMGERWVRWSLDDDSFRWLELPPGVEALRFRNGYMVGIERGAFGVEALVLYQVKGG